MKKSTKATLALLTMFMVVSCTKELDVSYGSQERLSEKFKNYRIVTLSAKSFFDKAKNAGDNSFDIQIDNGFSTPWEIKLNRTKVLPEGLTCNEITASGFINKLFDIRSFKTTDNKKDGVFTISEDYIGGNFINESGVHYFIEPLVMYDATFPKNKYIIYDEKDVTEPPSICGVNSIISPTTLNKKENIPSAKTAVSTCWKLEIRAEGDWEYYLNKGSNTTTATWAILANLVGASNIYKYIGINLVINGVGIYNAPPIAGWGYVGVEAESLLPQMSNHWLPYSSWKRDANVLFTGKNITANGQSSTKGVAWWKDPNQGWICVDQNSSYCIVEGFWASQSFLSRATAHEIGHLLSADHTSSGIMYSCTSCISSTTFNATSIKQINTHIWYNNGCLTQSNCE